MEVVEEVDEAEVFSVEGEEEGGVDGKNGKNRKKKKWVGWRFMSPVRGVCTPLHYPAGGGRASYLPFVGIRTAASTSIYKLPVQTPTTTTTITATTTTHSKPILEVPATPKSTPCDFGFNPYISASELQLATVDERGMWDVYDANNPGSGGSMTVPIPVASGGEELVSDPCGYSWARVHWGGDVNQLVVSNRAKTCLWDVRSSRPASYMQINNSLDRAWVLDTLPAIGGAGGNPSSSSSLLVLTSKQLIIVDPRMPGRRLLSYDHFRHEDDTSLKMEVISPGSCGAGGDSTVLVYSRLNSLISAFQFGWRGGEGTLANDGATKKSTFMNGSDDNGNGNGNNSGGGGGGGVGGCESIPVWSDMPYLFPRIKQARTTGDVGNGGVLGLVVIQNQDKPKQHKRNELFGGGGGSGAQKDSGEGRFITCLQMNTDYSVAEQVYTSWGSGRDGEEIRERVSAVGGGTGRSGTADIGFGVEGMRLDDGNTSTGDRDSDDGGFGGGGTYDDDSGHKTRIVDFSRLYEYAFLTNPDTQTLLKTQSGPEPVEEFIDELFQKNQTMQGEEDGEGDLEPSQASGRNGLAALQQQQGPIETLYEAATPPNHLFEDLELLGRRILDATAPSGAAREDEHEQEEQESQIQPAPQAKPRNLRNLIPISMGFPYYDEATTTTTSPPYNPHHAHQNAQVDPPPPQLQHPSIHKIYTSLTSAYVLPLPPTFTKTRLRAERIARMVSVEIGLAGLGIEPPPPSSTSTSSPSQPPPPPPDTTTTEILSRLKRYTLPPPPQTQIPAPPITLSPAVTEILAAWEVGGEPCIDVGSGGAGGTRLGRMGGVLRGKGGARRTLTGSSVLGGAGGPRRPHVVGHRTGGVQFALSQPVVVRGAAGGGGASQQVQVQSSSGSGSGRVVVVGSQTQQSQSQSQSQSGGGGVVMSQVERGKFGGRSAGGGKKGGGSGGGAAKKVKRRHGF
ncbi:RNA polymerase I-specific transcription-initiation factor-domain-containing protein [Peziza echinospora]|nr:RNA polymerase I-specific transcription-initiation factor-domain-containing protein [Peziza echinospora]